MNNTMLTLLLAPFLLHGAVLQKPFDLHTPKGRRVQFSLDSRLLTQRSSKDTTTFPRAERPS